MKIPVIVLSGFLGSGKTTLLVQLLKETKARGLRPGILMNELGRQDVDGQILDESSEATVEKLLDGCVCCSKKDELAGSLKLLLAQRPDVVYIELTGVANPEEIADALTEPGLLGTVQLKQIVTVLDGEHTLEYNSIFSSDRELIHTLRKQMEAADIILINKTDLVSASTVAKIEKNIRKHNEKALVIPTVGSRMDLDLVLGNIAPYERAGVAVSSFRMLKAVPAAKPSAVHRHSTAAAPSFSRIRTITLPYRPQAPMSKTRLEQFLSKWSGSLLRAKGYVAVHQHPGVMLMQFAGKRTYWEASQYAGEPYIVFIAIDLDQERLEAEWASLMNGR